MQFFCEIERLDAQQREKFTLVPSAFAMEYATMVAVMMPQPPPGVDPKDEAVKLVMQKICASRVLQPLLAQTIEERLAIFLREAEQNLEDVEGHLGHRREVVP